MFPSYTIAFQNLHPGMSDEEHYAEELRLAELAEPLGFGGIWCVEHHFDGDYSMCPDNMQLLSYLAGRTERVRLVTAAVILPWWDSPLRVAEKVVLLDHLSKGRLVLGVGRGLARMEYEQFGIDMNTSRERFDESIRVILRALDTGVATGEGRFYPQPEATLRPAPTRPFHDRLLCVALSPDSLGVAAELGAGMMTFAQFPIEKHAPLIEGYRDAFRAAQGREAPPPTLTELAYCHHDPAEAERIGREHITRYFLTLMRHYELDGGHFASTSGYHSYAEQAEMIREAGQEAAAEAYFQAQCWGTPEQILEKVHAKRAVIGDYHLNCGFSYGGLPYDKAEASMRLFADHVIPELSKLDDTDVVATSPAGEGMGAR